MSTQVLLVECDDRCGLVHVITGVLLKHGVNVVGNQEFVERGSARFFMRTDFDGAVDAGRQNLTAVRPAGVTELFRRHAFHVPENMREIALIAEAAGVGNLRQ